MSTKQLIRTALDGRIVTVLFSHADPINVWFCGMDDFHWMFVDIEGCVFIVHKSDATIKIESGPCVYEPDGVHKSVENVVAPFRRWLQKSGRSKENPAA